MKEIEINPHDIYEGSFADKKVTKVDFDGLNKIYTCYIEGCETDDSEGNNILYKNLRLQVSNWWKLTSFRNLTENGIDNEVETEEIEPFDEILIYELTPDNLVLEGYGKTTNQWLKLSFTRAKIELFGILS